MAIVINSTTGEIDLDATTPNTYVVTYTVEGVSSTQEVTVNALDNAAFTYSANSFAPTDADPTPTITGLTGGTFSAGSGLVFVDSGTNTGSSTGQIDLSASTIASYTITYDTTSSGSRVCPNTSTFGVTIALTGIANNYSMNFDGINDYIKADTISSLNNATQATLSFWAKRVSGQPFQVGDWVSSSNSFHIEYYVPNNTVYFVARNGSGGFHVSYVQSFDTNWHHYVGVYDGSNVSNCKLYVDGVDVGTNTGSLNNSLSSVMGNNFTIGAMGSPTYYSESSIDEVAIFNTALTAPQVAQIYNATSTGKTADLSTISGSNLKYWNRMGD